MTSIKQKMEALRQEREKPRLYGWDAIYGPGTNGLQEREVGS